MSADVQPGTIDLARERGFKLGDLDVRPATLEVEQDGRREALEPRVMQVLVALEQGRGEVVSRDQLIQLCWGGRIVGDDAINRCVARLRKLSRSFGGFEIETVPRVGFRLSTGSSSTEIGHSVGVDALLAVLAFDNLSDDPGLAYFSDGVSEEILHAVGRGARLRVVGRSSSFAFRGPDKSAKNVAHKLGATHVLDGSVRRSGPRVRISVELVECAGQTSMWSERFDRDLSDVLAIQDDIAAAVAGALQATFSRARTVQSVDPVAYDLYLQTRPDAIRGSIPPSRAIPLLEAAVRRAPDFAPAWAALALYRVEAFHHMAVDATPVSVSRADVVTAIQQALQLDAGCALAHVARAHLLPWADYAGREAAFATALEADPQSTDVRTEFGWFLNAVGRNDEALRVAAEGRALDPLNARVANLYVQMLAANGRAGESLRATRAFQERWPYAFVFASVPLFLSAKLGDRAEYDHFRAIAVEQHSESPFLEGALRRAAVLLDPSPERRARLIERLHRDLEDARTPDLGLLTLAHQMGATEETFAIVEVANFDRMHEQGGAPPSTWFSPGIVFDRSGNLALMEDPRFVRLCAKLGLCRYWVQTDRWPDCARFVPYDFQAEVRRLVES